MHASKAVYKAAKVDNACHIESLEDQEKLQRVIILHANREFDVMNNAHLRDLNMH
jgi:hypothetical protein